MSTDRLRPPVPSALPHPKRIATRTTILGLALGGLLSAGCPGSLANPEDFKEEEQQPLVDPCNGLLTKKCALASCHDADSSSIDLTLEGREERTVDKPGAVCQGNLIDTAAPESSLLYTKCASPTQTCGSPMPLGTQGLDESELSCLLGYIQSLGAGGASAASSTTATGSASSSTSSATGAGGAG